MHVTDLARSKIDERGHLSTEMRGETVENNVRVTKLARPRASRTRYVGVSLSHRCKVVELPRLSYHFVECSTKRDENRDQYLVRLNKSKRSIRRTYRLCIGVCARQCVYDTSHLDRMRRTTMYCKIYMHLTYTIEYSTMRTKYVVLIRYV